MALYLFVEHEVIMFDDLYVNKTGLEGIDRLPQHAELRLTQHAETGYRLVGLTALLLSVRVGNMAGAI